MNLNIIFKIKFSQLLYIVKQICINIIFFEYNQLYHNSGYIRRFKTSDPMYPNFDNVKTSKFRFHISKIYLPTFIVRKN